MHTELLHILYFYYYYYRYSSCFICVVIFVFTFVVEMAIFIGGYIIYTIIFHMHISCISVFMLSIATRILFIFLFISHFPVFLTVLPPTINCVHSCARQKSIWFEFYKQTYTQNDISIIIGICARMHNCFWNLIGPPFILLLQFSFKISYESFKEIVISLQVGFLKINQIF